ncbi:hypothetical protein JKF63_06668 [Porcisia hertigi]|uniref:Exocyst complex component EXOC2/Sec5 N-terminal domain-containing protein n=1 Tax=Porcisia hertigi TaxID=2761500 RepID=A0A836IU07_9TRYP|nr:hypothetical protein JKF63_06668 [Porcisia hertigi]
MDGLLEGGGDHHGHPPLDVTSRAFQSKRFIQRVLANVSYAVFEGKLVDEVGAAEEHTGEALKQLIRDHLGVFINSKDAMDTVYNTDMQLFTGEALEHITGSFENASISCESLVKPITATFLEMQKNRKSNDMLNKFFSVLGVPGAIYESCGVKVAQRRQIETAIVAEDDSASSSSSSADDEDKGIPEAGFADRDIRANGRGVYFQTPSRQATRRTARGDEADDDEEDGEGDGSDGDEDGTAADVSTAKALGTLEMHVDSTAATDMYVVDTGEEVYFWYDTPLVRLKDVRARRHHIDHVANYEAAVLHLRRAMLYLEETYSLVDGTTLAGDDREMPKATQTSSSPGEGHSPSVEQGGVPSAPTVGAEATRPSLSLTAVGRSVFANKFSMALLRASLFLCSQLAEELVYADPADTVLIEDTLSMMMDASIASVKLHHFCSVLQETLGKRDRHSQVLTKLRTQLSSVRTAAEPVSPKAGSTTATSAAGADPNFHVASPLGGAPGKNRFSVSPNRSMAESSRSGTVTSAGLPVTELRRGTTAYQHPVQFFISVVQRQQKHLFHSSAAGILREASGWLQKAQTEAARGLKERQPQQELRATALGAANTGEGTAEDHLGKGGAYGEYALLSSSFLGTGFGGDGGLIGNTNDSFLQDSTFTAMNARGGTGRRPSSVDSPATSAAGVAENSSGVARNGGGVTDGGCKTASIISDAYASKMLSTFNTPESPFPTSRELRVGSLDMDVVLVSSCLQIRMHSSSLLNQLFTRADVESAVMAQAGSLNTFALRLCAECVGTLEHVVGSYWGGIATTLHSGVFDFAPEVGSPLHVILDQLLESTAIQAAPAVGGATAAGGCSSGGDRLQRSPSTALTGMHSRSLSRVGEMDDNADPSGHDGAAVGVVQDNAMGSSSADQLPCIRFIPALPHAFRPTAADGAEAQATEEQPHSKRLRDISVQAVHRMISSTSTTLQALFVAFINRSVVDGFVNSLAQYQTSDLRLYSRSERIELHAAVLYEVILSQWERMMGLVNDAVLRLKIVIGESSSSVTITSETQIGEVEGLLQELELLRTMSLRCYLHGVGVLSKAYLMALPLLQRHTDTSLDARVRSRLSRESVSSNAVHKLLNVLSVVMDRCISFFTRDTEVYDSVDLFAVKSESLRNDADEVARASRRGGTGVRDAAARRLLLRRRLGDDSSGGKGHGNDSRVGHEGQGAAPPSLTSPGDGTDTFVDPISELIAQFHSRLVMESLQDHEELVLALLSHLLLAFGDMQQLKCHTAMTDVTLHPDERERCVVECMADTLCLATTLAPILVENLLTPCLFEVIARQLPTCATPADVTVMLQGKQQQYSQVYLSVVEEHCQLAMDAMMNAYLALAQQPITDLIRRQGFVQPLFDWQRVSPQTAAAVRPYIADAIACIARAHETLNVIRQPVLGSAATQRLVAHLVRTFLTSFTSDVNLLELSVGCSSSFLVHGLTLLEAEAITILHFVDAVVAHVTANPTTKELLPELVMARGSLGALTQTLDGFATSVCEAIVAVRNIEGGSTSSAFVALTFLSRDKRHERRDGMVQAAMHTLRYMLDAINTELEESSLSSAALLHLCSAADAGVNGDSAAGGGSRSAVAERIVQRIEQRKRGYELRRARAAAAAQGKSQLQDGERKQAAQQKGVQKKTTGDGDGAADGLDGSTSTGRRRQLLRLSPEAPHPLSTSPGRDGDGDAAGGGEHFSPRTPQESERESWKAAEVASDVFQLAQDQRQRHRVRRTKRVDAAKGDIADDGAVGTVGTTAESTKLASTPAALRDPLSVPAAGYAAGGNEDDANSVSNRVPRRTRQRVVSGGGGDGDVGGGGSTRQERRANRFRRTNAL